MFCWEYCSCEHSRTSFCLNTCCWVSWRPGVGFLGYSVTLCLIFWGTARLFSRMACTTLHSYQQCGKVPVSPQNTCYYFLIHFWLQCVACGILVPPPGIKPAIPALGVPSFNHRPQDHVSLILGPPRGLRRVEKIFFILDDSSAPVWSF